MADILLNIMALAINGTFLSNLVYFERTEKVTGRYIHDVALKKLITVQPAKSDSDIMVCLQSYQGFIIDRSLVY